MPVAATPFVVGNQSRKEVTPVNSVYWVAGLNEASIIRYIDGTGEEWMAYIASQVKARTSEKLCLCLPDLDE